MRITPAICAALPLLLAAEAARAEPLAETLVGT